MNYKDIHRLILDGESQSLDFKKTISHLDKIAKALTAFANTKGGMLLVGVLDDGTVMGVNPEEEAYQLRRAAEDYCRPPVAIEIFEVEDGQGHTIIVADIPESDSKPHYAMVKPDEWRVYVRMHDKSVLAGKDTLRYLMQGKEGDRATPGKDGKAVLAYLRQHERVSSKQLSKILNISERRARRLLVGLMQDGWLLSHDFEKEPFYTLLH